MNLTDLQSQLIAAMKKGDKVAVETLRFLISAVKNEAINKYGAEAHEKLTADDIASIVKKQVKTHKESVEAFEKANRPELAEGEKAQLTILETFLPSQMSDDALKAILAPIAQAGGEFGPMMGRAMAAVQGQADGTRVAMILKSLL